VKALLGSELQNGCGDETEIEIRFQEGAIYNLEDIVVKGGK
jgi:hypothetical protein